jgi:aspartyl-tRNA(Asn)/glutamyl-tRNA(Gln) amidotransferase subunit A
VSAVDGMCEVAIGTDTGGSCRIPAALCGIVGYKPSKQRVPTEGAFPLSYSLDSIGPLARTVAQCAATDAVLAGEDPWPLQAAPLAGLRFGIPQGLPLRDLDETVVGAFTAAIKRLGEAGVHVTDEPMPLIEGMMGVNAKGGFAVIEAYAIHREHLKTRADDYDQNVRSRIVRGEAASAADYIDMMRARTRLVQAMDAQVADLDALVLPTTAIVAPTIAEMEDPATFTTKNLLLLRNTLIWNFFDMCAISLPLPRAGLPVGLMLVARNGQDRRLFRIAAAVETLFG